MAVKLEIVNGGALRLYSSGQNATLAPVVLITDNNTKKKVNANGPRPWRQLRDNESIDLSRDINSRVNK